MGLLLGLVPPAYLMLVTFCVGDTILATIPVDQIYWKQTFLSITVAPWGMDMIFTTATVILSDHKGPQHRGIGASFVKIIVSYSTPIGLGTAGTVEVYLERAVRIPQTS